MAISTTSYVTGALVLIIASGFVLTSGQNATVTTVAPSQPDPCEKFTNCTECLSHTKDLNCTFSYSASDAVKCSQGIVEDQFGTPVTNCSQVPTPGHNNDTTTSTTVAPPPPANTTTVPPTTAPTTTKPTSPTTPPTTTVVPTSSTNGTSTVAPPPSNGTSTAAPVTSSTAAPAPPHGGGGGMSWASFFGGIVFTAAVSSVGYLVWRFYKARQERNYHTLTTNLI